MPPSCSVLIACEKGAYKAPTADDLKRGNHACTSCYRRAYMNIDLESGRLRCPFCSQVQHFQKKCDNPKCQEEVDTRLYNCPISDVLAASALFCSASCARTPLRVSQVIVVDEHAKESVHEPAKPAMLGQPVGDYVRSAVPTMCNDFVITVGLDRGVIPHNSSMAMLPSQGGGDLVLKIFSASHYVPAPANKQHVVIMEDVSQDRAAQEQMHNVQVEMSEAVDQAIAARTPPRSQNKGKKRGRSRSKKVEPEVEAEPEAMDIEEDDKEEPEVEEEDDGDEFLPRNSPSPVRKQVVSKKRRGRPPRRPVVEVEEEEEDEIEQEEEQPASKRHVIPKKTGPINDYLKSVHHVKFARKDHVGGLVQDAFLCTEKEPEMKRALALAGGSSSEPLVIVRHHACEREQLEFHGHPQSEEVNESHKLRQYTDTMKVTAIEVDTLETATRLADDLNKFPDMDDEDFIELFQELLHIWLPPAELRAAQGPRPPPALPVPLLPPRNEGEEEEEHLDDPVLALTHGLDAAEMEIPSQLPLDDDDENVAMSSDEEDSSD